MHYSTVRVRYGETDQAGVAYHANYLLWFEVGRTELLRDCGITYADFEQERGLLLTVVDTALSFKKPARYDEEICIGTWVSEMRRVRFRIDHRLTVGGPEGAVLCTGHVWLACVTPEARTRSLPDELRSAVQIHHDPGKTAAPPAVS